MMIRDPKGMYSPARLTQIDLGCTNRFLTRQYGHPTPKMTCFDPWQSFKVTSLDGSQLDNRGDRSSNHDAAPVDKKPPMAPRPAPHLPLRQKNNPFVLPQDMTFDRQRGDSCNNKYRNPVAFSSETFKRNDHDNSFLNRISKSKKIGGNSKSMTAMVIASDSGGESESEKTRNRVMADRRLQQLINVSYLITDGDVDIPYLTPNESPRRGKPRRRKMYMRRGGDPEDNVSPAGSVTASCSYMDRREINMKATAQQCEHLHSDTTLSDPNSLMRMAHRRGLPRNHLRLEEDANLVNTTPLSSRVQPPLCKIKAPMFDGSHRVSKHDLKQSLLYTTTSIRSSCKLWGAILKRRDPSKNRSSKPTSVRADASQTKHHCLTNNGLANNLLHDEVTDDELCNDGRQIGQLSWGNGQSDNDVHVSFSNGATRKEGDRSSSSFEEEGGEEDVQSGVGEHNEFTTMDLYEGQQRYEDSLLSDNAMEEGSVDKALKYAFRTFHKKRNNKQRQSAHKHKEQNTLSTTKSTARHESPSEFFFPPYMPGVSKPIDKKNVAIDSETKSFSKSNNHETPKKHVETSRMFWKSLVEEEDCERDYDSLGEQDKTHAELELFNVARRDEKEKPERSYILATQQTSQNAAPPEVTQVCLGKGYEVLRKLVRGKTQENITLYLANNEANPDFSPVEISVVRLPSKSLARSFLEASAPDHAAVKRKHPSSRSHEPGAAGLLPSHPNLLMRLHVFMFGVYVYQVSSHCQWPSLSHLLESATQKGGKQTSPTFYATGDIIGTNNPVSLCPRSRGRDSSACSCNCTPGGISKGVFVTGGLNCRGRSIGVGRRCSVDGKCDILQESAKKTIFKQICEGLKHLHEHGVLHGDLNCSNILVTDKLQVKLTGFGPFCLHTPWESPQGESCNPPIADPYDVYIPPEIMGRRSYRGWARSSDIWCLGMTLLHMTLGEVNQQVNCAVRLRRSKQFKTLCLSHMSYQMGLLLESLLQVRPQDRPSISDVCNHAWFSDGTDLASDINKITQSAQATLRTDGRTFPLPKRIREAFATAEKCSTAEPSLVKTGLASIDRREHLTTQWSYNDDENTNINDADVTVDNEDDNRININDTGNNTDNDEEREDQYGLKSEDLNSSVTGSITCCHGNNSHLSDLSVDSWSDLTQETHHSYLKDVHEESRPSTCKRLEEDR